MTNSSFTDDVIDIEAATLVENDAPEKSDSKPHKQSNLFVLAGVALISAMAGGWLYRDVLENYLPSDQITAVISKMETLEAATATLSKKVDAVVGFTDEMKSQLGAARTSAADIPELQSELAAGKTRLDALQKSLASLSASVDTLKSQIIASATSPGSGNEISVLSVQLDKLTKDVASLKQSGGANADTAVLSQSLANLKAKIAAGTGFKDEIDRIKLMVPAADGLDVLEAHAQVGLPNTAGLAIELKALSTQMKPVAQVDVQSNGGWWNYAAEVASGLVTVKSDTSTDWNFSTAAALERIDQSDLQGAINAFAKTEGQAPIDLRRWLDRATARLDLEQALNKVTAAVLRQMASKG